MKSWDLKYICTQIKYYEKLVNESSDEKLKSKYQQIIYSLKDQEDMLSFSIPICENFYDLQYDDKIFLKTFGFCAPQIRLFSEIIPNFKLSDERYPKINIDKNILLEFLRTFFYDFNKEYGKIFDKIISNGKNRLNFKNRCFLKDIYGYTVPLYGSRNILMNIGRCNNIQDFLTGAHEFGHAISYLKNPSTNILFEKYLLSEFMSLFFEILMRYYLTNFNNLLILNQLKEYQNNAICCCLKMDVYSQAEKDLNKREFVNYLKNSLQVKSKYTSLIANTSLKNDFCYVYSYLIAVELFLVYLEDKSEVLRILDKVTKLDNMTAQGYAKAIESYGIKPAENVYKFYKKFGSE